MNSKTQNLFLPRQAIYDMLTKEDNYAQGWAQGKQANNPVFPDHVVNARTGEPFTEMEWLAFAEKYIDEAKLVVANYTPDSRAVRIRLLKAASLLVTALQVHGCPRDMDDIAGVSSNKFPVQHGGLQTFKESGGRQSI